MLYNQHESIICFICVDVSLNHVNLEQTDIGR